MTAVQSQVAHRHSYHQYHFLNISETSSSSLITHNWLLCLHSTNNSMHKGTVQFYSVHLNLLAYRSECLLHSSTLSIHTTSARKRYRTSPSVFSQSYQHKSPNITYSRTLEKESKSQYAAHHEMMMIR